jgi:hypothetical protein
MPEHIDLNALREQALQKPQEPEITKEQKIEGLTRERLQYSKRRSKAQVVVKSF